jgi:hypothetical protein
MFMVGLLSCILLEIDQNCQIGIEVFLCVLAC